MTHDERIEAMARAICAEEVVIGEELQTAGLREAAKRVGAGECLMSIPARPDVDVDLLLVRAADELDRLRAELSAERDEVELKSACIAGMREAAGKLAAENDALRAAAIKAAHLLERARIWGGMGWTWNPLHGQWAKNAWEALRVGLDATRGGEG